MRHLLTTPFHLTWVLTLIVALLPLTVFAHSKPQSILTLETPSGKQIHLTRADLQALPQTQFTTSTPWTSQVHTYQGPKLSLLIEQFEQPITSIQVFAYNGYAVDINKSEWQQYPFILAMKQDGQELTLRNKGPLWILLPFDQNPTFSSKQSLLNQSIWQIEKIKAL
ncbi:hypothetical protein [Vibrio aphrogenes]|uniref:hypothetical protein n=1 Tax=Vibrio aphrogenes TaxID=1891186 RepID=UPI000B35FD61|nr:hypothetical protein [Vibrio aphrogenes]